MGDVHDEHWRAEETVSAGGKHLLVIAAHPDDEVLGCGATVRRLVDAGWTAHVVWMTGGVDGRYASGEDGPEVAAARVDLLAERDRAADVLGFSSRFQFGFPDNRMDTVSRMDLSRAIRGVVEDVRPDLIFTPHPGDYNWDHTLTFEAALMACRRNPGDFAPTEIRSFEVLSSSERGWRQGDKMFRPTLYVDARRTIDAKKQALCCYASEYRPYPHPRSIEALEYLARQRGNEVGLEYAEAFQLIRKVEE